VCRFTAQILRRNLRQPCKKGPCNGASRSFPGQGPVCRVYTEEVQISAKVDYALRALVVLASAPEPMTADAIAAEQILPVKFLGVILNELRRAGIVVSHRGREAGYNLGRPASKITMADVIRALEGPLAQVRGLRPETATYQGAAQHLQDCWIALRAGLRAVMEHITVEDILDGRFSPEIAKLIADPGTWVARRLDIAADDTVAIVRRAVAKGAVVR
jgi:Rrf2 family protein